VMPAGDRTVVGICGMGEERETRAIPRGQRPSPGLGERELGFPDHRGHLSKAQPGQALGVGDGLAADFRPYFRWNRSTRPSLSISFCRPVNRGWHLEQISTLWTGTVDRVWITSPQAQVMMAGMYGG